MTFKKRLGDTIIGIIGGIVIGGLMSIPSRAYYVHLNDNKPDIAVESPLGIRYFLQQPDGSFVNSDTVKTQELNSAKLEYNTRRSELKDQLDLLESEYQTRKKEIDDRYDTIRRGGRFETGREGSSLQ